MRCVQKSLGIKKKSVLYISHILFNYLQNTSLGSSHISPSGSATTGNKSRTHSLRRSTVVFLIISTHSSNRFPFSIVFRIVKSQKSHGGKSGEVMSPSNKWWPE